MPDITDKEFQDFLVGGTIVETQDDVALCFRCDGFGYTGHEQKIVDGVAQPDYSRTIRCKACSGSGYIKSVVYTRDDGTVYTRYFNDDE